MSNPQVEQFIYDVFRNRRLTEFNAAPETFLDAYHLSGDERGALLGRDYGALYQMGVHPMAVLFYAQANKTPMPEYLRQIGAEAQRVAEFRGIFQGTSGLPSPQSGE